MTRHRLLTAVLATILALNITGVATATYYPFCVPTMWNPCVQMSINEAGIREIGKSTTGGAIAGVGGATAAALTGPIAPVVAGGIAGLGILGGFLTGVSNSYWDGNLRFGW